MTQLQKGNIYVMGMLEEKKERKEEKKYLK